MNLKTRIERLELARSEGVIEVLRGQPDGAGALTVIRDGRVLERRGLNPDEVRQWVRQPHVTVARSYGQQGAADAA